MASLLEVTVNRGVPKSKRLRITRPPSGDPRPDNREAAAAAAANRMRALARLGGG